MDLKEIGCEGGKSKDLVVLNLQVLVARVSYLKNSGNTFVLLIYGHRKGNTEQTK
jgi:hypothetical protein